MNPNELLRIPELIRTIGLKRSAIYARVSDGRMPAPVHIGTAALWPADEIAEWVRYIRENRCEPPAGFYPQHDEGRA
jgi:prophage regulatory protein